MQFSRSPWIHVTARWFFSFFFPFRFLPLPNIVLLAFLTFTEYRTDIFTDLHNESRTLPE